MVKLLPWAALPVVTIAKLVTDVDAGSLTPTEALVWVVLLVLTNTCEKTVRGVLADAKGMPFSIRALAKVCGVNRTTIRRALRTFAKLGWITKGKGEVWHIQGRENWLAATAVGARMVGGRGGTGGVPGGPPPVPEGHGDGDKRTCPRTTTPVIPAQAEVKEVMSGQEEVPSHMRWAQPHNGAPAGPIEEEEKGKTINIVGGGNSTSTPQQQRPEIEVKEDLLRVVDVVFARAVGRPLDAHDHAALAELIGAGHGQDEIVRAVEHYGARENAKVRRAGLRYVKPMILRGMFRPGTQGTRPFQAPQTPDKAVIHGIDPTINQKRQAQTLARQDQKKVFGGKP